MIFYKHFIFPAFLDFLSKFAPINIGALTYYPWIISESDMSKTTKNHETIHIYQQFELIVASFFVFTSLACIFQFKITLLTVLLAILLRNIPFLFLYYSFYLINIVLFYKSWKEKAASISDHLFNGSRKNMTLGEVSYVMIPFEKEAYDNDQDEKYLTSRVPFAWLNYIIGPF